MTTSGKRSWPKPYHATTVVTLTAITAAAPPPSSRGAAFRGSSLWAASPTVSVGCPEMTYTSISLLLRTMSSRNDLRSASRQRG